jgi:DNA-binding NarL/FixJ family response regulator
LQQRFKYHLLRFALSHHWELVHEWLEASLEKNLGLTPQQWRQLKETLSEKQVKLLTLKQQGMPDGEVAKLLGLTPTQFQKQWTKLLEQAWEIRNL